MKAIRAVDGFSTLKRVRSHGEKTGRYTGIRRRTKKDDQIEERSEIAQDKGLVNEEEPQSEIAKAPLALKAYRRF